MNRLKKQYQPIAYSLVLIIGILIGHFLNTSETASSFQLNQNTKINNILRLINADYVDNINQQDLEESAIKSILKELDPHSTYIGNKDIKSVNENMEGSFGGIGVEFNIQQDTIVVVSPIAGGPSERLGIKSGDRIVDVEGESVTGISIDNDGVIERLRGKIGTKVSVKIKRKDLKQLLDYTITRGEIPLHSLDVKLMLNNDIGFIKINRFSATTFEEFFAASTELLGKGMRNLILDLRGNPGGYLESAINISNQFLGNKEMIVFTEGRSRQKQTFFAEKGGLLTNCNVVVLVDEGSASASEIVAGALQDNDRGKIIGRRTFGKGLVQEQIPLYDGSVVRLTTQRYYTPTGRSIQKAYKKGENDGYFTELHEKGVKDSAAISDSLIFTTPKGNIVYGGGGITPDILIANDTSLDSKKLAVFFAKNWVFDFCFEYADKYREILSQETLINTDIWVLFIAFVKKKKGDFVFDLGEKEITYLKKQIRARVGRNLFGNEAFYQLLLEDDKFVSRAITEF